MDHLPDKLCPRNSRREALFRLVQSRGALSLEVMRGGVQTVRATDLSDMLEELNAAGRIRWLGHKRTAASTTISYGAARRP